MDLRLRIEVESFQAEAKLKALQSELRQLYKDFDQGKLTVAQYEARLKAISTEAGITRQQLTKLKTSQEGVTQATTAASGAQGLLLNTMMRYVSAAAVGAAIKSTIDWGSRLSDLSKKTHIGVEALQRLDYAAGRNGASLEMVTNTVAMFADRLGSGDKSAVAAIKKLGLSYQELLTLKPEVAFARVADALVKVPTYYQQAALAADIFGRSWRELLPMLGDVADALGSDLPVASEESFEALDAVDDAMSDAFRAGKAIGSELLGTVLEPMVPVLQALADAAEGIARGFRSWWAMEPPKWFHTLITEDPMQFLGRWAVAGIMRQPKGPGAGSPTAMPEPLALMDAWEALELVEADEKLLAKTRRDGAKAAREAAAAEKALELSIQSWVRHSRAINPIIPAEFALPTPGFSVPGPVAGSPWGGLFGGMGGGTNTWFQAGLTGPQVTPGWSGPLPGQPLTPGQITGAKPPGAWGQLGGSLMGALPSVLMSAFTGGGNVGRSVGGLFGGQMGSWVSTLAGGGIGKALGGVMGSILPGIGTLLGGALGGLFGKLFGPSEASKTKKMRNEWLEQAGGIDAVRKMADYAGISIDKLLSTKKTKTFEAEVRRLEAAFKATQERVQQLTTDLGDLAARGGLLTKDMVSRLQTDLSKPEVAQAFGEFISTNLERAGTALTDFVTKSAALPLTEQSARGLGAAFAGVYQQLVAMGKSGAEALRILQPGIDALATRLQAAGLSGGAAFAELQAMAALAADAVAGPLLDAMTDMGAALVALHNTGILTQEMFVDLASTITQTFTKLVAEGKDSRLVMILMQKPLQQLWELMQDFGYEVDEATRSLLAQAEEAGLVGEKFRDAQKLMLEALNKLIARFDVFLKQLGVELPEEARKGAQGAQDAIDGIKTPRSEAPEPGDRAYAPSFQHGSRGIVNFGAETWARLHGREAVLTEPQYRAMAARGRGDVIVTVDARGALLSDAASQAKLATIISDAVLRRTSLLYRGAVA